MISGEKSGKRRSDFILFAMILLKGFTLLPLPQTDELLVSLFSIAKTEWVGIGNGSGKGALDVFVGGRGPTRFSEDLLWVSSLSTLAGVV